jgi:hypothetical protein
MTRTIATAASTRDPSPATALDTGKKTSRPSPPSTSDAAGSRRSRLGQQRRLGRERARAGERRRRARVFGACARVAGNARRRRARLAPDARQQRGNAEVAHPVVVGPRLGRRRDAVALGVDVDGGAAREVVVARPARGTEAHVGEPAGGGDGRIAVARVAGRGGEREERVGRVARLPARERRQLEDARGRGSVRVVVLLRPAGARRASLHRDEPVAAAARGRLELRAAERRRGGEQRRDRERRRAVVERRLILVVRAQPAEPRRPRDERPRAGGELRAHEQVDAALGRAAVADVAGRPPEGEQEARRARRDVVVDPGTEVRGGAEPPRERRVVRRQLGEPSAGCKLRRDEEVARVPRGLEIRVASGAPPAVEEHEPRRRRARAAHDDEVPRREPERGEEALGRAHDDRERRGPRARWRRERPAAGGTLGRDERVERVGESVAARRRRREGERQHGDEPTDAR